MSLAQTKSVALLGLDGHVVTVEVDIADGLPMYSLLGLPDAALSESRDRVRAAIVNCSEIWPNRKVTVSLSPAWLPKSGSSFDLAICIALLSANETISPDAIADVLFLGELSLDGRIRSVRGTLPALIAAQKAGIKTVVVPRANFQEAQLMQGIEIIAMEHVKQVLRWLRTGEREIADEIDFAWQPTDENLDFADVAGQPQARLAAEIAA
jgi:magnesium chelatase family protein